MLKEEVVPRIHEHTHGPASQPPLPHTSPQHRAAWLASAEGAVSRLCRQAVVVSRGERQERLVWWLRVEGNTISLSLSLFSLISEEVDTAFRRGVASSPVCRYCKGVPLEINLLLAYDQLPGMSETYRHVTWTLSMVEGSVKTRDWALFICRPCIGLVENQVSEIISTCNPRVSFPTMDQGKSGQCTRTEQTFKMSPLGRQGDLEKIDIIYRVRK